VFDKMPVKRLWSQLHLGLFESKSHNILYPYSSWVGYLFSKNKKSTAEIHTSRYSNLALLMCSKVHLMLDILLNHAKGT
jgi:hypothetical protein